MFCSPMRVLQVFNEYLDPGGEQLWVDRIPQLVGDGVEIQELRFRSREWIGPDAPSRFRQAYLLGDNPESRRRLAEAVHGFQPDVLLFHNLIPVASFGLYDEAFRLGVPVVQYLHNFRPFSPSGTLWVNGEVNDAALHGNPWPEILAGAWTRSRIRTAIIAWHQAGFLRSGGLDTVRTWIAVSEFLREKFIVAGLPRERVKVLRHCWQLSEMEAKERDEGYYLFLGRLCEEKGVETLLNAWRILEKRFGSSCPRLVIAGGGVKEKTVRDAAGCNPRIDFAGHVVGREKEVLISRCRAMLAPSIWWEPLGLIVYEAYSHRRPVIASCSGGLAETVKEGITGLLHRPGDAESLADCVERMEGQTIRQRAELGMAGRKWLASECSVDVWNREFLGILHDVIG